MNWFSSQNMYVGKYVIVTLSLPRGKNHDGVGPVDNRLSTNKEKSQKIV